MQKRKVARIRSRLKIWFSHGNELRSGTVTDLSEEGMFIHADINFPFYSKFEVDIPLEKRFLRVPVEVSRLVKRNKFYEKMAVKVLSPKKDYLEFVNRLKLAIKSYNDSVQIMKGD